MLIRVKHICGVDLGAYQVKNAQEEQCLIEEYLGLDYDSVCIRSIPEFALFKGRHVELDNLPSIFGNSIENPRDTLGMMEHAERYVWNREEIAVYVTGLTVATIAVVNACRKLGVRLTLMHWDREFERYYVQDVAA